MQLDTHVLRMEQLSADNFNFKTARLFRSSLTRLLTTEETLKKKNKDKLLSRQVRIYDVQLIGE